MFYPPAGITTFVVVTYREVMKAIVIDDIKDALEEKQGKPVYVQIKDYGVYIDWIVAEWDQQTYNYSSLYERDYTVYIDMY